MPYDNGSNTDEATITRENKNLFDWYTPQLIKASLGDITTSEHNSKKANAIIIVQSESGVKPYGLDDNKKPDKELIKNAVSEEFGQAFKLLEQTKLPICFVRGIPHYDEGYRAQVAGHYIFLYFSFDHNNKKSVLVVDPQGSKFGDCLTDQNEKAIDKEFVDIVYYAVSKNKTNLYVSKDVIQQDGRSCGPVSVELVRAFYEISNDEGKKEKLFKILKVSKLISKIFPKYKLCELGTDIIPQSIIDDFNTIRQVKFTGGDGKSHYISVGGEKIKKKHYSTATLVNKKNKHLKEVYFFISHIKSFLIKLGADPNLLDLEKLCPSFRSGIITGAEILNQSEVQVEKNAAEASDVKDNKRKKSKVKFKLDDGKTKDLKQELSNEEKRNHQYIRKNSKRIANKDYSKHIEIQNEECQQKLNPCLTLLIAIFISGIILSSVLLSISNSVMNIGKMINIAIIATSSIILTCTVSVICLVRNKEAKVSPNIDDLNMQNFPPNSQPINSYGIIN